MRRVQETKRPKNRCLGVWVQRSFSDFRWLTVGGRASQLSTCPRQSLESGCGFGLGFWDLDCRLLSITPPMNHHRTRMPLALE